MFTKRFRLLSSKRHQDPEEPEYENVTYDITCAPEDNFTADDIRIILEHNSVFSFWGSGMRQSEYLSRRRACQFAGADYVLAIWTNASRLDREVIADAQLAHQEDRLISIVVDDGRFPDSVGGAYAVRFDSEDKWACKDFIMERFFGLDWDA